MMFSSETHESIFAIVQWRQAIIIQIGNRVNWSVCAWRGLNDLISSRDTFTSMDKL